MTTFNTFCSFATLAGTQNKHPNPFFDSVSAYLNEDVTELRVRSLRDTSIVIDETSFISHSGRIDANAEFAIERQVIVGFFVRISLVVDIP